VAGTLENAASREGSTAVKKDPPKMRCKAPFTCGQMLTCEGLLDRSLTSLASASLIVLPEALVHPLTPFGLWFPPLFFFLEAGAPPAKFGGVLLRDEAGLLRGGEEV
jgi:hypothetical protein